MRKIICAIVIAVMTINVGFASPIQNRVKQIVNRVDSVSKSEIVDSVNAILSDTVLSVKADKADSSSSSFTFYDSDDNDSELSVAIVAIVSPFIAIFLIVLICLVMGYMRRRAKYKLIEKAIENGYELPEYLFYDKVKAYSGNPASVSYRATYDNAIKWIAVGVGTCLFFLFCDAMPMFGLCSIILIIGISKLQLAKLDNKNRQQYSEPAQPESPIVPPPIPEDEKKCDKNSCDNPQ
ncbi:MAG: DUF6249 domain-containing protein [Muribaculaceae bacterium]